MLACLGSKTEGYNILRRELEQLGFIHRQGSGYISEIKISFSDIRVILSSIGQRQDWLGKCVKKFDVSIAENNLDFRYIFEQSAEKVPFIPFEESLDGAKGKQRRYKSIHEREIDQEENEREM